MSSETVTRVGTAETRLALSKKRTGELAPPLLTPLPTEARSSWPSEQDTDASMFSNHVTPERF